MNEHLEKAKKWLNSLRGGTRNCDLFINNIRECASSHNFPLTDIGTSEKEIEHLRARNHEAFDGSRLDSLDHDNSQY